jgi:hypothetical protein
MDIKTANSTKTMALYLSVLPVYSIRKKITEKNASVNSRATVRGSFEKSGFPPEVKKNRMRIMDKA